MHVLQGCQAGEADLQKRFPLQDLRGIEQGLNQPDLASIDGLTGVPNRCPYGNTIRFRVRRGNEQQRGPSRIWHNQRRGHDAVVGLGHPKVIDPIAVGLGEIEKRVHDASVFMWDPGQEVGQGPSPGCGRCPVDDRVTTPGGRGFFAGFGGGYAQRIVHCEAPD